MCKQNVGSKGKAHDVQAERTGKRDSRRDLDLAFSRGAPCGARGCDTPRVALREACAREASRWLFLDVTVPREACAREASCWLLMEVNGPREACAREASRWLLVEVAVSCFCDKGMQK